MSGTGWFSEAYFVLFPELPHVGHWLVLGSLLRFLSRTPPCRALVGSRKLTSFSFQNSPMSGTGWFSEAYFVLFPELPHVGHWLVLGSLLRSLSRTPPCRALVGYSTLQRSLGSLLRSLSRLVMLRVKELAHEPVTLFVPQHSS